MTDLMESNFREEGLGVLIVNRWVNNHIVTFVPVHWGGDFVLVTKLKC